MARHRLCSSLDMLSLENTILDIEPYVSKKQEKICVNPYIGHDFV